MLGIIRVLTTSDKDILFEHSRQMKERFNIQAKSACIPDQPNGVYDMESEKIAVTKIVHLAKEMAEDEDIHAVTISCASDPAIEQVRKEINLPVFGAGECGAYAASIVGNRVGVIGIKEAPPLPVKRALGDKFFSYSYSRNRRKTTDLLMDGAKEDLRSVVEELVDQGADVILFACTGFSTIGLKDYLVQSIQVPIIDLVDAQAIAYRLI